MIVVLLRNSVKSKQNRAGFLLIEIAIALLLFTTAAVGIAHFYWRTVAMTYDAQRYLQATTLAHTMLENFSSNSFTIDYPEFFTVHQQTSVQDLPNFAVVELKISWPSFSNDTKSITVISGFHTIEEKV